MKNPNFRFAAIMLLTAYSAFALSLYMYVLIKETESFELLDLFGLLASLTQWVMVMKIKV